MKVIQIQQAPAQTVSMEGTRDVKMRVLLAAEDGAPGFTMRLFELGPQGYSPQHAHAHEHEVIIQSGSGTLWTPGQEYPLAPGIVALVPPDQEHQFRAGQDGMSFFCMVPHEGH